MTIFFCTKDFKILGELQFYHISAVVIELNISYFYLSYFQEYINITKWILI